MEREISKKIGKMDLEILEMTPNQGLNPSSTDRRSQMGGRDGSRDSGAKRELNPALFGATANRAKVLEGPLQAEFPHLMQNDQRINDLKTQMSAMVDHIGKLTQQFSDLARWAKNGDIRFERIQSQLGKLEQNDHYIVSEAAQKFSQVNTRFGERKSIDIKIQEMMDRHGSVLKSFEMRLSQMQRILAEKEAQLLATTAALNESKMEIARLKRM